MKKYKVILNNIDDIKKFVMQINKYDITADVSTDGRKQIVDAKSILGVISIASNSPINVQLLNDDKENINQFDAIMSQFTIIECDGVKIG